MFPDEEPPAVQDVICRLMEYLIENPDARDTVDGIERWWLSPPAPAHGLVERAIGSLLGAGWMNTVPDVRLVYQVSVRGLTAGKNYLNQLHRERE